MLCKLRASINGVVYDIEDYAIKSEDIELMTTVSDKIFNLSDTSYIVVFNDEKKHVLKSFDDDGRYAIINSEDYAKVIKYSEDTGASSTVSSGSVSSSTATSAQNTAIKDIKK